MDVLMIGERRPWPSDVRVPEDFLQYVIHVTVPNCFTLCGLACAIALLRLKYRHAWFLIGFFVLFTITNSAAALMEIGRAKAEKRLAPSPTPYVFAPAGCEFSVVFPEPPKVSTIGQNTLVASLDIIGGKAALIAEYTPEAWFWPYLAEGASNETLMRWALQAFCRARGFEYRESEVTRTELGAVTTLWADGEIDEMRASFKLIMYIGDHSALTVTIGSGTGRLQHQEMIDFENSVRRVTEREGPK